MKAKHQRLTLVVVALFALLGSGLLAASALREQAAYFYAPGDLQRANVAPGKAIRLGGMVADGSIERLGDGVTVRFVVTDGQAQVPVTYRGIVPDLFKENSGVVAEGRLTSQGAFVADNILAKHDERYMPPQLEGMKHKSESLAP